MSFLGEIFEVIVRDTILHFSREGWRKWVQRRDATQKPPAKKKRQRSKKRGVRYE